MTSRELPRHYHVWDAWDYRMVVAGCLEGLSDEQVARKVGRTVAAIRDRAEYFIDPDPGSTRSAWSRLREELALDPDYDWEPVVRRHHDAEQLPYWDEAADELLERTWAHAAPVVPAGRWPWNRAKQEPPRHLAQLEEALGIHEFEIFKRLRYKALTTDICEVVERLGAAENGVVAARARILADRHAVTLYMLVVTDESGGVLHTSLHPDLPAAVAAKDSAAAGFAKHPLAVWTISGRSVGDGILGDKPLTGSFEIAATPIVDLDALDFGA
ncbi:hypothetical protein ACFXHA_43420 [Nocardia sp. NPDC059240]|uniref:hypothetical protein n=1 Tax=Nocardia sp. NPDC059240 TaxID=3346786 RepID=UPI0036CB246A